MALLPLSLRHRAMNTVRHRVCAMSTTSTSPRYPFPSSPNPTPYQIFHLPPGAPLKEVKDRYFELVKLYHPDSVDYRQRQPDPAIRHTQFNAITAAYNALTKGKVPSNAAILQDEGEAIKRAYRRRARTLSAGGVAADERWKDWAIWAGLGLAVAAVGTQYVTVRNESLKYIHTRARHLANNQQETREEHLIFQQKPKGDNSS